MTRLRAPGPTTALLAFLVPTMTPLILGTAAEAQVPTTPPSQAAPAQPSGGIPRGYALQAVSPHAHGTAVAASLRIHAGSQDDEPGLEGTAWLLGQVLQEQASRALDPALAQVSVEVGRATTTVTLLAVPHGWTDSWAQVERTAFQAPLDPTLLEAHRRTLLEQMAFEAGSPFRDFETEAVGMLAEPGSPFARPLRGTPTSVATIGPAALERFRDQAFRREAAALAVVGPVDATPLLPPAGAPAPEDGDVAWLIGDRVSLVRDVTNTWISVAYPVPTSLPRTHLELLAHLMEEELDPTPPPPDRYGLDVRIEETPRGPVLVVEASVFPEASAAWEARILGVVRRLADEPMGEDFFRWRRRRFRAARLLEESAPEAEARRLTGDLLRDGGVRDLEAELWSLDAGALQRAAQALGQPRIFLLGPDLGQDGSRDR